MSKSSKKTFKKAYEIATKSNRSKLKHHYADVGMDILDRIDNWATSQDERLRLRLFGYLLPAILARVTALIVEVTSKADELLKDDGTQTKPTPRRGKRRSCKTDGTRTPTAGFELND